MRNIPADAPHADERRELATRAARAEGRECGRDRKRCAVDCPYGFHNEKQFAYRTAWLRGFSEGRGDMRDGATRSEQQHVAPPVGDPVTLRYVADMVRSRAEPQTQALADDKARSDTSSAMLSLALELEALAASVDARYGQ